MDTANVVIRKAEFEDIPILEGLIRESVRTLQAHDYSPRQMEGALSTVFGVDRQLIRDGTDRLPGIRSRLTDDKGDRLSHWALLRRDLQQFDQVVLPQHGAGMRAVAAGFVAGRDQNVPAVGYPLDLALQDAQLRRIDLVIRRIDGPKRSLDLLQQGRRVVVGRTIVLVEHVVGVGAGGALARS